MTFHHSTVYRHLHQDNRQRSKGASPKKHLATERQVFYS
ncbi:hypothetical protein NEIFL0001_1069 [Neisseria flavescens SK114]|nr:hypothetical protein NEIFL0001_1069 [Neisseria flavescens SK114]